MELVDRIKQMKADRKSYFDVDGDGVDVLLSDLWSFLETPRPTPDGEIGEDDAKWVLRMAAEFHAERLPKDFWPGIAERFDRIATTLETQAADIARRDKVIGIAADALDLADNIIAVNLGTDTPAEWNRAMRKVAKARAATRTDVR